MEKVTVSEMMLCGWKRHLSEQKLQIGLCLNKLAGQTDQRDISTWTRSLEFKQRWNGNTGFIVAISHTPGKMIQRKLVGVSGCCN